jgi:LacI family transcriptional regulator
MKKSSGTSSAPTIRDVAALAKVSTATVSHVLNNTGRAGTEARERVTAAIGKLGYRPNGNAASLRSRRSRIVGLVVPSITNSFFAQMASEFEALAMEAGYEVAIVTSHESSEREHDRVLTLLSRQIDGLIIYPSSDEMLGQNLQPAMLPPTVLMDRGLGLDGFDTVGLNNEIGGTTVARYLVEQGHRKIAVLVPSLNLAASRNRAIGVEKALLNLGSEANLRVVVGGHSIDGARSAIEQELCREDGATALIATTNVATLGAIKAIQALQLNMPQDVSLVGFDDFEWMTALRPYVSAFAQPTRTLATKAWEILQSRMEQPQLKTSTAKPFHITVDGEFKIRESSGKVRR